jgi:rhodanese-related sulfurtransferase
MGRFISLRSIALGVVILAALAVAGCSPAAGNVDNAQFQKLQETGVRIVDVRTAVEYNGGYIKGAENVPLGELATAAGGWDRSEPVGVYCQTGSRSAEAMRILTDMGFKTVYNLTMGIEQWDGAVVESDSASGTGGSSGPVTSGLPVAYEFYTDW